MIPKVSLAALVACLLSATALAGQTAVHRDTLGKYTFPTPKAAQTFSAGQTILERGNTVIERFDNLSPSEPAVFVANYLLSAGEQGLLKRMK